MESGKLINNLAEEVKELKYVNENLKSLNNTLSKEINSIESRLVNAEHDKHSLIIQCRQLKDRIDLLAEEKEAEISELKEKILDQIVQKRQFNKVLEDNKIKLNEAKEDLAQSREEAAKLKKDLELLRKRENDLRREVGGLQLDFENEILKNKELREELEDCKQTIKSMRDEVDFLRAEKEVITQKMVRKENDYESIKTILSYGGNVNANFSANGMDICSEIFDKDGLTESRLGQTNLMYPIDTSFEQLSPIKPPPSILAVIPRRQSGSPITSTGRKQSLKVQFQATPNSTFSQEESSSKDISKQEFGPCCFLMATIFLFCYFLFVYPLKFTYHHLISTILLPSIKVERVNSCQ